MASKINSSLTGMLFVSAVAAGVALGVHSAFAQNMSMPQNSAPPAAMPAAPTANTSTSQTYSGSNGWGTTPPPAAPAPAAAPPGPIVVHGAPDPTPPPFAQAEQNLQSTQNMQNMQNMPNIQNSQNLPNSPNSLNNQNAQPLNIQQGQFGQQNFMPRQNGRAIQPGQNDKGPNNSLPGLPSGYVPSQVEHVVTLQPSQLKYKSAILRTSLGDISIRLFSNDAPNTVNNFMRLAMGEKEFIDIKTSKKVFRPFYNGLIFHHVLKGFSIQTGCPFGTGRGDPGYSIPDEISASLKFDKPGMVAMALQQGTKLGTYDKDSNGSQFFITLAPAPALNGKMTIFGEVIHGMDVAQKIGNTPVGPTERPIRKVYLYSVDIIDPEAHPVAMPIPMPASASPTAPASPGSQPSSEIPPNPAAMPASNPGVPSGLILPTSPPSRGSSPFSRPSSATMAPPGSALPGAGAMPNAPNSQLKASTPPMPAANVGQPSVPTTPPAPMPAPATAPPK